MTTINELRVRAKALGYKTIHRRGNDYYLIDSDGDHRAGAEGLDGASDLIDGLEADRACFDAGGVMVHWTACGVPMSALDRDGSIPLSDPRVAALLATVTQSA
jgi:hypothetical protein